MQGFNSVRVLKLGLKLLKGSRLLVNGFGFGPTGGQGRRRSGF